MLVLSGGACRSVYALFHEWEAKLDLVYKTSVFLSQEKVFFSPHSLPKHLFKLLTEKWISFKAHFKTILIRCVGTKWIGNCCPSSEAGLTAMLLLADGDITVIILAFLHLNFILIKLVCLFTLRGQTQQLEAPWYTCAIATKASCLRVKTSWPLFVVVLCIAIILMSHMPKTCALHCILNVLQDGLGSFSLILVCYWSDPGWLASFQCQGRNSLPAHVRSTGRILIFSFFSLNAGFAAGVLAAVLAFSEPEPLVFD